MRRLRHTLALLICFFLLFSCKKDSKQPIVSSKGTGLESDLVTFSVDSEMVLTSIDTVHNIINPVLPADADWHKRTINLTLQGQVNASVNGVAVNGSATVDFTKPVKLTLTTSDKKYTLSFSVTAQTEMQYFGVEGTVLAQNSLTRDYDFYFDQADGSLYAPGNCGPASSSMVIKWADSTFTGTPAEARSLIEPQGADWSTGDIMAYLQRNGVSWGTDTLDNVATVVKNRIDNDNGVLLCLDMYQVTYNAIPYQHTSKFYPTDGPTWGHCIFIKGYVQTTTGFYLEAYDPFSGGRTYTELTTGQLMGKSRYYYSQDIQRATATWWPYYISVAEKGKYVTASGKQTINSLSKPIPVAYVR